MSEGMMSPAEWLRDLQGVFNPGPHGDNDLGLARLGKELERIVEDKKTGVIPQITGIPGVKGTDRRLRLFISEKGSPNPVTVVNVAPLYQKAKLLIQLGQADKALGDYFAAQMKARGKSQTLEGLLAIAERTWTAFEAYDREIKLETGSKPKKPGKVFEEVL